jgi:hypothetical protein
VVPAADLMHMANKMAGRECHARVVHSKSLIRDGVVLVQVRADGNCYAPSLNVLRFL